MQLLVLLFFVNAAFSKFYYVEWHADSSCVTKYAIWAGWIGEDFSCVQSGEKGSLTSACQGDKLTLVNDENSRNCEQQGNSLVLTVDNSCRVSGTSWYRAVCVEEKLGLPDQDTPLFGTGFYVNDDTCASAPAGISCFVADTCLLDTYFNCATKVISSWNNTLTCAGTESTSPMNSQCSFGVRSGACFTIGDLTSTSSILIASALLPCILLFLGLNW